MNSFIIAIIGIVSMMVLWITVQSFWRSTFKDHIEDEDVLATRISCGNCGCTTVCDKNMKQLSTE